MGKRATICRGLNIYYSITRPFKRLVAVEQCWLAHLIFKVLLVGNRHLFKSIPELGKMQYGRIRKEESRLEDSDSVDSPSYCSLCRMLKNGIFSGEGSVGQRRAPN